MKKSILLVFAGLPAFSYPVLAQQNNPEASMQMMEKAQNCMMQLNFQELASLEAKSEALKSEILSLCASNNESEAKQVALKFSDEVMNSDIMTGMKKCFSGMPGMEAQLKVPDFRKELEQKSICDVIREQ